MDIESEERTNKHHVDRVNGVINIDICICIYSFASPNRSQEKKRKNIFLSFGRFIMANRKSPTYKELYLDLYDKFV